MLETACAGRAAAQGSYLIRMPARQSIPRITASQLVSGVFREGELSGLTAIVAPPPFANEARLATPLDPHARATGATPLAAYAIQSLIEHREVRRASSWQAGLVLLLVCLSAVALVRRVRNKRLFLPAILCGSIVVVVAASAMLGLGDVLLPVSVATGGFILSAIVQILRQENEQDRRLDRTLERAINLSFSRSVFYDPSSIPTYLETVARLLRLPRMIVIERGEDGRWRGIAAHGARPDECALENAGALLAQARLSATPVPAAVLVPRWKGQASLALLSEGDNDLAWIYELPPGKQGEASAQVARAIAVSLRAMRQWQHTLLGGEEGARKTVSIEDRVSSAARLITVQSEQIREGLDALDTAVLIYHPVGFPIQANARMLDLCDRLGLALEKTSIGEAITAFTGLAGAQADTIVQRMLLRGGEMRVPMNDIASRQYALRVGASTRRGRDWQRVIVLEAVDISELDQLAQLRLAVGTFIDRQLRNDLEAIALGASLALDPRLESSSLARIVGRIKDVAARATGRLEQVSDLLGDAPIGPPSPSYPIEARKSVAEALERALPLAEEMSVRIESRLPAISGFTLAEPLMLADTVEAILRLIISDTAQGEVVRLDLDESETHTLIKISGGYGMPFDRLCEALDARPGEVPAEFQIAAAGFAEALAWQGTVSYWSAAGDGYRFNIRLRRIG